MTSRSDQNRATRTPAAPVRATRLAVVASLGVLLLVLPVFAAPARADHSHWSIGAGFHVGNVHFRLAFGGHDHHRPGYYYRTDHRLRYRGHRCSDRCFRAAGSVYHHPSCSLVAAHFDHHHVAPVFLFDRYAPPPVWRGRYYDGHRFGSPYVYDGHRRHHRHPRVHHDRHHRDHRYDHDRHHRSYDRHDRRHWKDRRHDGHRGRGHGHERHHRRDRRGGPHR